MSRKLKRIILIICIVLLVIGITVALIFRRITPLERVGLDTIQNNYASYYDILDDEDSNDVDQYIAFVSYYTFNESGKSRLNPEQIHDLIKKIFNIDMKVGKIRDNGESPLLSRYHIMQDPETKEYIYSLDTLSQSDIAEFKIYAYQPVFKIKIGSKKFIVKYKKYEITTPYDVMNYYNDVEPGKIAKYDTSDIYQYLTGSGKVKAVKIACSDEVLKKYGKEKGTLKVTYKVVDNNVQIIKMK